MPSENTVPSGAPRKPSPERVSIPTPINHNTSFHVSPDRLGAPGAGAAVPSSLPTMGGFPLHKPLNGDGALNLAAFAGSGLMPPMTKSDALVQASLQLAAATLPRRSSNPSPTSPSSADSESASSNNSRNDDQSSQSSQQNPAVQQPFQQQQQQQQLPLLNLPIFPLPLAGFMGFPAFPNAQQLQFSQKHLPSEPSTPVKPKAASHLLQKPEQQTSKRSKSPKSKPDVPPKASSTAKPASKPKSGFDTSLLALQRTLLPNKPNRVAIPSLSLDQEPIYVNAKQYHRILKRREQRQRHAAKIAKRKPRFLHESRHRHAVTRVRGFRGRFVKKEELEKLQQQEQQEQAQQQHQRQQQQQQQQQQQVLPLAPPLNSALPRAAAHLLTLSTVS